MVDGRQKSKRAEDKNQRIYQNEPRQTYIYIHEMIQIKNGRTLTRLLQDTKSCKML